MEKFIERAIACLKSQDCTAIEFFLVNSGSTDSTMNLVEPLIKDDQRFQIFSIEDHGYGYACNYGIKHANGDFFAIFEPDDWIPADFYSELKLAAEHNIQANVIRYNGFYKVKNNQKYSLYHWEEKFIDKIFDRYEHKRFWKSHPSVFNGIYRTNFIRMKDGYFRETPGASYQDVMFMVSLFYLNPLIYILDKKKYCYQIHKYQSINFVNKKVDAIIDSWIQEKQWMDKHRITKRMFFLLAAYRQMLSVRCKLTEQNRKKIIRGFKELKGPPYFLYPAITYKEKIKQSISTSLAKRRDTRLWIFFK